MKSYREVMEINIKGRRGFRNITPDVERALQKSGVREGLALVNAMNITASVFINDDESGLHADYEKWLEKQIKSQGFKDVNEIFLGIYRAQEDKLTLYPNE